MPGFLDKMPIMSYPRKRGIGWGETMSITTWKEFTDINTKIVKDAASILEQQEYLSTRLAKERDEAKDELVRFRKRVREVIKKLEEKERIDEEDVYINATELLKELGYEVK